MVSSEHGLQFTVQRVCFLDAECLEYLLGGHERRFVGSVGRLSSRCVECGDAFSRAAGLVELQVNLHWRCGPILDGLLIVAAAWAIRLTNLLNHFYMSLCLHWGVTLMQRGQLAVLVAADHADADHLVEQRTRRVDVE